MRKLGTAGIAAFAGKQVNSIIFLLGVLVYRLSLDILYSEVISNYYSIYGFDFSFDLGRLVYSYVSLVVLTILLSHCRKTLNASYSMLMFLYLFAYVPNGALYAYMDIDMVYMNLSNLYWLFMMIAYYMIPSMVPSIPKFPHRSKDLVWKITPYVFLFAILAFSYSYNGLKIELNLSEVYEMRMASHESGMGSIMSLLLPWAGSVVFPLTIIDAMRKRQAVKAGIFIVAQLITFSINGTKTWLFLVAVSVVGVLLLKKDERLYHMPWLFAGINIISYLESVKFESSFLANFIVRRVFFSTSLNNWYHITFFDGKEKLYLTHSIFGWVKKLGYVSPYPDSISAIIGQVYYDADTNASSGTIADAYDNFGIPGAILFPFILIFFFKLMDRMSVGLEIRFLLPLLIVTTIFLLNGSIFTVLITYGYIFSLWYVRHQKRYIEEQHAKTVN